MRARYLIPTLGIAIIALIYVGLGLANLRIEIRQSREALEEQVRSSVQGLRDQVAQLSNDTSERFDQQMNQVSDIRQEMICRFNRVETKIDQKSTQLENLLIRVHAQ